MPVPVARPRELADATRHLVREHLRALTAHPAPDDGRAADAVASLEREVDASLAPAFEAAMAALDATAAKEDGRIDTRELGHVLDRVDAAADGDPDARVALAYAGLRKRLLEAGGALFSARRLLSARPDPNDPDVQRRWHALLDRVHTTANALLDAVDRWARAADGAPAAPAPVDAVACVSRARSLLEGGAEDAARVELARALEAVFANKAWGHGDTGRFEEALAAWDAAGAQPPSPVNELRRLHARLRSTGGDAAVAWRLLDAVDAVVARADMTPWPDTQMESVE